MSREEARKILFEGGILRYSGYSWAVGNLDFCDVFSIVEDILDDVCFTCAGDWGSVL